MISESIDKLTHRIRQQLHRWERDVVAAAAERKQHFTTISGLPLKRLYTPNDVPDDYVDQQGFPGQYPYTRGVQPTMYRGRLWTMRQYAGFGTAHETNVRFKFLLERGQGGLSVAFDLPTQIGYDADDQIASGEVGKVGVSISSLHDMQSLFDGIPLEQVSTSMTINAPATILLAMYIAVAKRQGADVRQLRGTVQNDILKEYSARGTYIYPPQPSMRLVTDLISYCHREVPRWNAISVSGYHIREAGSTAAQELAFTLANAIAYVQATIDSGLDVDDFAPQLSFFFNAHNDFLEEIAKYRAARRMWAHIMRHRFNAQNPRSWQLKFHAQTAGSSLTAQQAENNVVRVTIQALAAVLGGAQSLHTNSYDEALALPTEAAVHIALRTQQIIAHESGVASTADPLGGSYAIENLTTELEQQANQYIQKIDDLGGALQALQYGFFHAEIQEAAYRTQRAIEQDQQVVVGLNAYQSDEDLRPVIMRVDPAIEQAQRDRLASLRATRDNQRVAELLGQLETAAKGNDNLMPLFIICVEADVTLGEICNVLREVFGEYRPDINI